MLTLRYNEPVFILMLRGRVGCLRQPTLPIYALSAVRTFYALKNPAASAGFEPANLGTKGQHATPRPPKSFLPYIKKISVTLT